MSTMITTTTPQSPAMHRPLLDEDELRMTIHATIGEARRALLATQGDTLSCYDVRLLLILLGGIALRHTDELRLDPFAAGVIRRVARRQAEDRARMAR